MVSNWKAPALIFGGLFAVVVIACGIYVLVNQQSYGSEFEEFSKNENQSKIENLESSKGGLITINQSGVIDAPLACEKGMRYDSTTNSCRRAV
jgi:hypothetical protein